MRWTPKTVKIATSEINYSTLKRNFIPYCKGLFKGNNIMKKNNFLWENPLRADFLTFPFFCYLKIVG